MYIFNGSNGSTVLIVRMISIRCISLAKGFSCCLVFVQDTVIVIGV